MSLGRKAPPVRIAGELAGRCSQGRRAVARLQLWRLLNHAYHAAGVTAKTRLSAPPDVRLSHRQRVRTSSWALRPQHSRSRLHALDAQRRELHCVRSTAAETLQLGDGAKMNTATATIFSVNAEPLRLIGGDNASGTSAPDAQLD